MPARGACRNAHPGQGPRYPSDSKEEEEESSLVAPDWADAPRIEAMASAEALCRDLVNTPASDMGPDVLADEAAQLAAEFGVLARDFIVHVYLRFESFSHIINFLFKLVHLL